METTKEREARETFQAETDDAIKVRLSEGIEADRHGDLHSRCVQAAEAFLIGNGYGEVQRIDANWSFFDLMATDDAGDLHVISVNGARGEWLDDLTLTDDVRWCFEQLIADYFQSHEPTSARIYPDCMTLNITSDRGAVLRFHRNIQED